MWGLYSILSLHSSSVNRIRRIPFNLGLNRMYSTRNKDEGYSLYLLSNARLPHTYDHTKKHGMADRLK